MLVELVNVATVESVWSAVNIYQPNIVNILVNGLLSPVFSAGPPGLNLAAQKLAS